MSEKLTKSNKTSNLNKQRSIKYHNKFIYWNRQAWANRVDPDKMLQNVASDQGLHCLSLIQQ